LPFSFLSNRKGAVYGALFYGLLFSLRPGVAFFVCARKHSKKRFRRWRGTFFCFANINTCRGAVYGALFYALLYSLRPGLAFFVCSRKHSNKRFRRWRGTFFCFANVNIDIL